MFDGYRGDAAATAAAFAPGGWFRTGDLARLGVQGYLTIVDRRTDMVSYSVVALTNAEWFQRRHQH